MIARVAFCAVVVLFSQFEHAKSQVVRFRVVDEQSRQPILGAQALVIALPSDTVATLTTGADGFFSWQRKRGTYEIVASAPQYERVGRVVVLEDHTEFIPAFVLTRVVIPLDTLHARTASSGVAAPTGLMDRRSFLLHGADLASLERSGATLPAIIQQVGPLRVRHLPSFWTRDGRLARNYMCIESNRRLPSFSPTSPACDPVVLIVDGVAAGDPHDVLRNIRLTEVESIEYLPPVDAGLLYGMEAGASGAIVIWTRGFGPHRSAARGNGQ